MPTGLRRRRSLAAALLLLASACVDRNPLSPDGTLPAPASRATLQCQVTVATGTMTCAQQAPATTGGVRANVIGGQEINVKLTSSGTSYDNVAGILSSTVTVQNLLQQTMGVDSLGNVTGIKVYFLNGPVLTSGSGDVQVANEDGEGPLTTGMQPYFLYNGTLETFEISEGKLWQFSADNTVETFAFTLVVETSLSYGARSDRGAVWKGGVDSLWTTAGNWVGGVVPDSTYIATIPPADSVGKMPRLTGDVVVAGLHVGRASTLNLEGWTLNSLGSVDAVGTVSGGTVRMTGAGALLQGNVNALVLTGGSTTLQGATKATGAVSIQGAPLNLNGKALSISVP